MDIASYLRRIDYAGSLEPTLPTLRALHYAHLLTVPFENLDIHRGVPIVLDDARLFDKIVVQRRGGFCYELNGLFAALLRELGFRVRLLSGRVPIAEGVTGPEFDHMALLVELEAQDPQESRVLRAQPWLVDVGYGESFVYPLALQTAAIQSQRGVWYRMDEHDGRWRVLRFSAEAHDRGVPAYGLDSEWRILYDFTVPPHEFAEFTEMCLYHQTSPDSHFTRRRICSRLTPTGRITLTETRLVVTDNGGRSERVLADAAQYAVALHEHFGISLPWVEAEGAGRL